MMTGAPGSPSSMADKALATRRSLIGGLADLSLAGTSARTQRNYPDRPIRLVVPYGPGAATELLARQLASGVPALLGQRAVIDNRPGANAVIGTELVARSPPDGYTLLFANDQVICINPELLPRIPYDPARDFAPVERKVSKYRHEFGTGAIEGVAGPEAANNAASQTSFIPLLTLGIPANAVMALMVGALVIQGIQPGPRMVEEQPDLFWGFIASMWIGNLMLLVINLPMIGIWVKLLQRPCKYLYPSIVIFCAIGVYSLNNNVFDIYQTLLFGIIGYLFIKLRMEPAPLQIGFVLGPITDECLRRAMLLSHGDAAVFIQRPISAVLLGIGAIVLIATLMPAIRKGKDEALAG